MTEDQLRLELGAASWNHHVAAQRKQQQDWRPDLRGVDVHGMNLSGADLSYANLSGANLSHTILNGTSFRLSDLHDADLSHALLEQADIDSADLSKANLSHATLIDVSLLGSTLRGATLWSTSLDGVTLDRASLVDSDWNAATLTNTSFVNSDLRGASFNRATLNSVDMSHSRASEVDFRSAKLLHVNFADAEVSSVTLTGASLNLIETDQEREPLLPQPGQIVVRIEVELPASAPHEQVFAVTGGMGAFCDLAQKVGNRVAAWSDDWSSGQSNVAVMHAAEDSHSILVHSMHYGSPWWVQLLEIAPAVPVVAWAARDIVGRGPGESKLLNLLFTFCRPSERRLFFEKRKTALERDVAQNLADVAEARDRASRAVSGEIAYTGEFIRGGTPAGLTRAALSEQALPPDVLGEIETQLPDLQALLEHNMRVTVTEGPAI